MEGKQVNDILKDSPILSANGGTGAGTGAVTRRRARVKSTDLDRLPDFRGTGAGGGEQGGGGGGGLSNSGTLSGGELPTRSTGTDSTNGDSGTIGAGIGGGSGGASAGLADSHRATEGVGTGREDTRATSRAGTISLGGSSDTGTEGGRSASEETEYLGFPPVAPPVSPAAATGAVRGKGAAKGSGAVRGKGGGSAGSSAPAMPEPSPLYHGLVIDNLEQMLTLWLGAGFISLASVRGPHWLPDNLEERLVPISANLGADIRQRMPALISKIECQAPLTAALVQLGMLVAPIIAVELSLAGKREGEVNNG